MSDKPLVLHNLLEAIDHVVVTIISDGGVVLQLAVRVSACDPARR